MLLVAIVAGVLGCVIGTDRPNIIFILADDLVESCLAANFLNVTPWSFGLIDS